MRRGEWSRRNKEPPFRLATGAFNAAERSRTSTPCGYKNLNLARLPIPPQPRLLVGERGAILRRVGDLSSSQPVARTGGYTSRHERYAPPFDQRRPPVAAGPGRSGPSRHSRPKWEVRADRRFVSRAGG